MLTTSTTIMRTSGLRRDWCRAAASVQGLQTTLFERAHGLFGKGVASLLTVQYRMHASIMTWASDELYGGALTAHPSVAGHLLRDLEVRTRFGKS